MKNKVNKNGTHNLNSYPCEPYTLIVGVISGSVTQIKPLINDIRKLSELKYLKAIEVWLLSNGANTAELTDLLQLTFTGTDIVKFTITESDKSEGILPIGKARSTLQKLVGARMSEVTTSFGWILDDDMTIPVTAEKYLTWLPAFKHEGVDVLIGGFNGGSPNPVAHGIRVQLNDLLHNLYWLADLPAFSKLPDRSEENKKFRMLYPDYYYDLSRKHTDHLVKPYWVVPEYKGEKVGDAHARLIRDSYKVLTGEPYLRPLIMDLPSRPLEESKPSCNRGGNTFILTSKALTMTPNTILLTDGKENRRSDMIWAIINKYYYKLNVQSVSFPINHHRYIGTSTSYCFNKTVGEIRGACTLCFAMSSFFESNPNYNWELLNERIDRISELYFDYINQRLELYKENFIVINSMLDQLVPLLKTDDNSVALTLSSIREWVSLDNLEKIQKMLFSIDKIKDLDFFLNNIVEQITDF
ncbi:hypothetical protein ACLKMH_17400 [Psychromonas sp. KJ10-10]|uniref:hypothetical protein n=1 Tax=Psychromonas sp. KJ10-10 TaxID=3391823 RepID=UPI0039B69E8F